MTLADISRAGAEPYNEGVAGPLLLWLAVQVAALGLAAAQVPLSARYPEPADRQAVGVMMVAQVGASALLFPVLLRSAPASVAVVVTAWPFLQLAGFLSGTPSLRLVMGGAYLTLWLAGLGVWRGVLHGRNLQLAGVAVASALALGGPMLWYLRMEFALDAPAGGWASAGLYGPLMGALNQVHAHETGVAPWILPSMSLVLAVLLLGLQKYNSRG